MGTQESATNTPKPATSTVSRLSNVLPTGTFLVFQILAPLATNNGKCGHVEIVLTSVTLCVLCLLCVMSSFSDSCKDKDGMVHFGIVTRRGLWNINFNRAEFNPPDEKASPKAAPPTDPEAASHTDPEAASHTDPEAASHTDLEAPTHADAVAPNQKTKEEDAESKSNFYKGPDKKYVVEMDDFVCAALSVVALATISLLTAPVTTCFYPHISDSILKTVPVLVGLVVAAVCACGVTPRNGIGFTDPTAPAPTEKKQPD